MQLVIERAAARETRIDWPEDCTLLKLERPYHGRVIYPVVRTASLRRLSAEEMEFNGWPGGHLARLADMGVHWTLYAYGTGHIAAWPAGAPPAENPFWAFDGDVVGGWAHDARHGVEWLSPDQCPLLRQLPEELAMIVVNA